MNKTHEQIIALAGLFQATDLVDQVAQQGQCDKQVLETSIKSLFVTNPKDAIEVYGDLPALKSGLEKVHLLLANKEQNKKLNSVRYALAIMHLEAKLRKNQAMLETIGQRLSRAENQIQHFGLQHENVFEGLASIYIDTISSFKLRIQVSGNPDYLKMPLNAAKIRALLLASIRSATLWRQVGGHRWHFLLKRKSLADEAKNLLDQTSRLQ